MIQLMQLWPGMEANQILRQGILAKRVECLSEDEVRRDHLLRLCVRQEAPAWDNGLLHFNELALLTS